VPGSEVERDCDAVLPHPPRARRRSSAPGAPCEATHHRGSSARTGQGRMAGSRERIREPAMPQSPRQARRVSASHQARPRDRSELARGALAHADPSPDMTSVSGSRRQAGPRGQSRPEHSPCSWQTHWFATSRAFGFRTREARHRARPDEWPSPASSRVTEAPLRRCADSADAEPSGGAGAGGSSTHWRRVPQVGDERSARARH
jgi:hypothetical protein